MSGIEKVAASKFKHGTRARYVKGCRCRPCTYASTQVVLKRDKRYRDARREIGATGNGPPLYEVRITGHGTRSVRYSENTCPGIQGKLCPHAAVLRKDSLGGVCGRCGNILVRDHLWNGMVEAKAARHHLIVLSNRGIGYKSVADAASIANSTLFRVMSGKTKFIRAETEKAILEIDEGARADKSLVDARPVWKKIRYLMKVHGYTKARISAEIGQNGISLQLGKRWITARYAYKIEKLYRAARYEPGR